MVFKMFYIMSAPHLPVSGSMCSEAPSNHGRMCSRASLVYILAEYLNTLKPKP